MAAVNPGLAGLEAWWQLDEANGNAIDSHSKEHDLVETGGTIASTEGGRDFELTETEYFTRADHADLSFADEAFTLGAWVKLESQAIPDQYFIGKWDYGNNDREYALLYDQGEDRYRFRISSNGTLVEQVLANTYGAVPATTQAFVMGWHDPVANKIYISVNNGVADEVAWTTGCNDNISAFVLGALITSATPATYLDGIMWSAFVARKIFTADERTWLYNSGVPRTYAEIENIGTLDAAVGDFDVTGIAANPEYGRKIFPAVGDFDVSEVSADLLFKHKMPVAVGDFDVSGVTTNLEYGRKLATIIGGFAIAGTEASLRESAIIMQAAIGSYALTGTAADLLQGYSFDAEVGAFTFSGVNADLLQGYGFDAEVGAFTFSGLDANLEFGRKLAADIGSYALTGTAANLRESDIVMSAAVGEYLLTGTVTGLYQGYGMLVDVGSYAMSGVEPDLLFKRIFHVDVGSYLMTGTAADLLFSRRLAAEIGAYILTGTDASLRESAIIMSGDVGSYIMTGTAAFIAVVMEIGNLATSNAGVDGLVASNSYVGNVEISNE